LIEMELISREVTLIRAALRSRSVVAKVLSHVYGQLANRMKPAGLYRFGPTEAACVCLALHEFADTSRQIGLTQLGEEAQRLADEFLQYLFVAYPIEEACDILRIERERRAQVGESIPV